MVFIIRGQLRTASHCVRGVFVSRNKLVCIGRNTDYAHYKQQGRCCKEPFERSPSFGVAYEMYEKRDGKDKDHDSQIVCDLDMVCLYLHA